MPRAAIRIGPPTPSRTTRTSCSAGARCARCGRAAGSSSRRRGPSSTISKAIRASCSNRVDDRAALAERPAARASVRCRRRASAASDTGRRRRIGRAAPQPRVRLRLDDCRRRRRAPSIRRIASRCGPHIEDGIDRIGARPARRAAGVRARAAARPRQRSRDEVSGRPQLSRRPAAGGARRLPPRDRRADSAIRTSSSTSRRSPSVKDGSTKRAPR